LQPPTAPRAMRHNHSPPSPKKADVYRPSIVSGSTALCDDSDFRRAPGRNREELAKNSRPPASIDRYRPSSPHRRNDSRNRSRERSPFRNNGYRHREHYAESVRGRRGSSPNSYRERVERGIDLTPSNNNARKADTKKH